jgi:hypothetical protein
MHTVPSQSQTARIGVASTGPPRTSAVETASTTRGEKNLQKLKKEKKKRKNYAGSESHSPHRLRKKSHFGTEYRKAPPA